MTKPPWHLSGPGRLVFAMFSLISSCASGAISLGIYEVEEQNQTLAQVMMKASDVATLSFDLRLAYAPVSAAILEAGPGPLTANMFWATNRPQPGVLLVSLAGANAVNGDGIVFTVTFSSAGVRTFLANANVNEAAVEIDSDGDGVSDRQESLAGTDPQNAQVGPQITATTETADGMGISFRSSAGKRYRIECNDNFPNGSWTTVSDNIAGTGEQIESTDLIAKLLSKGIYRVSVVDGDQSIPVSPPSGFYRLSLLGNSDTLVSIQFARPAAAGGLIWSVSENTLVFKGPTGWADNQWVYSQGVQTNTYYLLITGGTKEGAYYPIIANGANSLRLDPDGDTLADLKPLDRAAIIPYWTLGSIFPEGKGIHVSTSKFLRKTEVLVPNIGALGINLSAGKTYFFHNGIWKQIGHGDTNKNDDPFLPDAYLIVRHNIATPTVLTARGGVVNSKWRLPLKANPNGKQDNIVALPRPTATTLNESGLIESGAFRPSTSRFNRADELLIFDNARTGKNKSAAATYYHYNGKWQRIGSGDADVGNDPVFQAGTGAIIRKKGGADVTWNNAPTY